MYQRESLPAASRYPLPAFHRILLVTLLCLGITGCATDSKPEPSVSKKKESQAAPSTPSPPATKETARPTSVTPANAAPREQVLFDGKTLTGWKIAEFAGAAAVKIEPSFKGDTAAILLEQGIMTGITYTNDVPQQNYEISLDAMRVSGGDFFCALTFPVGKDPCSFIVGGWGGAVVGLSSVDGEDAAHNETTKFMKFEEGRWYHVRVRVTEESIHAWIDQEEVVNLPLKDRAISIRMEVELSKPLGVATWSTTGAVRNIRLKRF